MKSHINNLENKIKFLKDCENCKFIYELYEKF